MGLEAAVETVAEFLNKAVKPVLVAGRKLRVAKASNAFVELADACCYPVAVMPSAKDLCWRTIPISLGLTGVPSVGYSLLLKRGKAIIVQPERVVIGNGPAFGCVMMKDFLRALSKRLKRNATAYDNYHRIYVPEGHPLKCEPNKLLKKLKLPEGCGYEFQMQYGSIGWAVGATLRYA
ncbi:hypothetical protein CsSME_00038911 [Camellia sinensis var. sinensis]